MMNDKKVLLCASVSLMIDKIREEEAEKERVMEARAKHYSKKCTKRKKKRKKKVYYDR